MQLLTRGARLWALMGGVILAAIVAVTVVNVAAFGLDAVARLFGRSVAGISGYEDFVQLAIGAASPMFLPLCQADKGHLSVDFLTRRFGARTEQVLERIGAGLIALTASGLAIAMIFGMLETLDDNALSRVLGWPVWPFYLPGILSLWLWAAIAGGQAILGGNDADHLAERTDGVNAAGQAHG